MLVVVDGTGPDDRPGRVETLKSAAADALRTKLGPRLGAHVPQPKAHKTYDEEMAGSFCKQLGALPGARYLRGPTLFGSETSAIAELAVDAVKAMKRDARAKGKVILAGYSRGGCACIIAASRLKASGVDIDAMFLFDAVDMQVSERSLSRTIPDNVRYVAHARSGRNLGFWAENPVKSRFYFYNTGLHLAGRGRHETESFKGTHAALGGVPWVDIPGDNACALKVASWMNDRLKGHLDITLSVIGKSV